jgi:putative phosphonate catabolism associated alcohol dehydrogenase
MEREEEPFARGAVFVAPGAPLEIRPFPRPRLEEGELLVAVACCTLCGSDLHSLRGKRPVPAPSILGHEIVGRLIAWGGSGPVRDLVGQTLSVGDRVTWSIAASCGTCFYCTHGLPQKCSSLFKYGHQQITDRHPLSGGLATHCHLARHTPVLRVPDELTDQVASPANCATATVAGALRVAGPCRDEVVWIQGAGMLGLTAAAFCSRQGAARVLVTDVDPRRLARAAAFGATDPISVAQGTASLRETIREATRGRGVDLVLEMSGHPEATEQALRELRIGGRLILVGAVFPSRPLEVEAEQIVRRLLRIEGLHNYRPDDLVTAVEFLRENHGRFPFAQLVEAEFPLLETEDAVRYASESKAFRVAVRPTVN